MSDALMRALAAGATVVTPNRRLARHLADAHDRAQFAAGLRAWPSAHVLPWASWIAAMEGEAVAAGALPALVRIPPQAAAHAWRVAVEADAEPNLDPGALAASAAEAWEHVHSHGAGAESWRAWAGGTDEPAAFARWAERYRAALAEHGATDPATSADRAAGAAPAMPSWRGRRVALAGFITLTPQQRRVRDALERAGMEVVEVAVVDGPPGTIRRTEFASADAELLAALAWARREVERRPDARVGIVVPDLALRLPAVRARAREILGVPGDGTHDAAALAWNLSLGDALDATPVVGAAVDLLSLAWSSMPAGRAAALLRSAYLPGATASGRRSRATIERRWIERGVDRVRIGEAIAALRAGDDPLAARLAAARDVAGRVRRATRHAWIDAWRELLGAAGWPGERALSSAEHQARSAFNAVLATFATLDAIGGASAGVGADDALSTLAELTAATPFQPESPPAPIQILGLLEAVGLPFDALWIAGMSDVAWPRASRPHPLLPIRWQRERGVPRSDAALELAWAREVTARFRHAAPEIVVSHAKTIDDAPAERSALFAECPEAAFEEPATPARRMFDARPWRERLADWSAPRPVPGERHRSGSGLIETQSACPFQALAAMRWRAEPWPMETIGLTAMERGNLVHAALAAFWRATRDHASLVALAADATRYAEARERAVALALATIDEPRWRRIPEAVRGLEAERLARLLATWLDDVELLRPPFAAVLVEHEERLELGGLALGLRLDRLDELADGGVAIVDYKTGSVGSPLHWTAERPESTQLALYTLARRASHPATNVRAAVLGQVRRGDCRPVGLYADARARWNAPPKRGTDRSIVDWPDLEAHWNALMLGLADEFARGHAPVAPRSGSVCRSCGRASLCRIGDAEAHAGEDDEP